MKGNFILVVLILLLGRISAQITFPVNDIRDPQRQIILLKSGIIHPDSKSQAFKGDILVVNGKILNIGIG